MALTTAAPSAPDCVAARPVAKSSAAHPAGVTVRRRVLQGLFASALGLAFAPALVASGSALSASRSAGRAPAPAGDEERFDETYRGCRIIGVRYDRRPGGDGSCTWRVTVDGRPLHLMRRADGTWMSMVDHYQSYATPLAATRAAVDELGSTARLGAPGNRRNRTADSRTASVSKGNEGEHHHGVHP
ncbi:MULTISPECIES: tyrosinase family oxidase copper chaperone [Streptomyces]|uniref:tyrosinase family oxidase copper chaperone n=1 Tax=Streptomyces TaxID=1883 RepID=UPI001489959D|nr:MULTISPECIES: tyrosinase family oxidase copper chaperone [Streptomyces]